MAPYAVWETPSSAMTAMVGAGMAMMDSEAMPYCPVPACAVFTPVTSTALPGASASRREGRMVWVRAERTPSVLRGPLRPRDARAGERRVEPVRRLEDRLGDLALWLGKIDEVRSRIEAVRRDGVVGVRVRARREAHARASHLDAGAQQRAHELRGAARIAGRR